MFDLDLAIRDVRRAPKEKLLLTLGVHEINLTTAPFLPVALLSLLTGALAETPPPSTRRFWTPSATAAEASSLLEAMVVVGAFA